MHDYIERWISSNILEDMNIFPSVAILGPRQAGKSRLAARIAKQFDSYIRLDLENPRDRAKLTDPMLYFESNAKAMICIDEIQIMPELFPILRSVIDSDRRSGRFLILGSASRELINKSAESLAGRIGYQYLTPFLPTEYMSGTPPSILETLSRGGFPESALAENDAASYRWREAFLRSIIERDLAMLGSGTSAIATERTLTMCAHLQGQILNMASFGASLGISGPALRARLEFLQEALLLRLLPSWSGNLKKRLVKSPKLYIRDTGLCHSLMGIRNLDALMGHPAFGASWEALCVETLCDSFPEAIASYYRTSNGAELDLILEMGERRFAFECKASSAPQLTRGTYAALNDLHPEKAYIVCPIEGSYLLSKDIRACGLVECVEMLRQDVKDQR